MTAWLPQLTVSVSPAAAPVPVSPTTTGVPFEASPALMPPPLFFGDRGDRRRRRRRRVDRHRESPSSSALALPAASVSRAVTLNVPWPCAVIVAGRHRHRRAAARDVARQERVGDRLAAPVDGQRVARRRPGAGQPDHHRRAVRGLAGVDAAAAILRDRGDRRRRRRRRVDRHRGGRRVRAGIARRVGQPGRHVERAVALRRDRRQQAPSPSRCWPRCRPPGACR